MARFLKQVPTTLICSHGHSQLAPREQGAWPNEIESAALYMLNSSKNAPWIISGKDK
jgi:hypothetical protein